MMGRMAIEERYQYKELVDFVKGLIASNASGLLVSVPGMGASHYCKKLVEKDPKISFINSEGSELSSFNILDFDFDRDIEAGRKVDDYFKKATLGNKFLVVVNRPDMVESEKIGEMFFGRRIYKQLWMKVNSFDESKDIYKRANPDLEEKKYDQIYKLSGGLSRLDKFLAINIDDRVGIKNAVGSTISVLKKISLETKERMGFMVGGVYLSDVLKELVVVNMSDVNLLVGQDMILIEDGVRGELLTKIEKGLIELAVSAEENVITKEKIADQKWGEGSYDEYSDQAISKTIQRLNAKLKKHLFESISLVGYKLKRHG